MPGSGTGPPPQKAIILRFFTWFRSQFVGRMMTRHFALNGIRLLQLILLTTVYSLASAADGIPKDRSPVDLAITSDNQWLVTANQIANSVSLIRLADLQVVAELECGEYPVDIEVLEDGRVLVTCQWSGELYVLRIAGETLRAEAVVRLGFDPQGIAVSPSSDKAYIGLVATAQVAEVDLVSNQVTRHFQVGNWPKYLTISRDGQRLAVGNGGDSKIEVIDIESGESLYDATLANGTNLGQMRTSSDGQYAYFPWMVYRTNPINVGNIRLGWILASRIGRVRLDGPAYREAISLDVPGKAVADPHDLEITADQTSLVVSAAGTHELLVYRLNDLPFVAQGGPGDLIDRRLQNNPDRFHRIELGGRPMGLRIAADNQTVYVANYLHNSVQVVDLPSRQLRDEISLGGPAEKTLARKGMEIFYDGRRSLDQWYSCHSCHQEGGINARPMDTMNDGTEMTLKTVLPLHDLTKTFPWTWHGWQTNLSEAMSKSITSTMQGPEPSEEDVRALIEFLSEMKTPPNPFRLPDGSLSEAAERGKQVFFTRKAACADCHNGSHYTDGKIHDVGLGSESDHYQGYNTPSLVGVYRKVRLLHSGRAKDLHRVVTDLHRPELVNGEGELSEQEVADLIEFLKSL
jgi:DNA-binding beta-propeller fold protein YncE